MVFRSSRLGHFPTPAWKMDCLAGTAYNSKSQSRLGRSWLVSNEMCKAVFRGQSWQHNWFNWICNRYCCMAYERRLTQLHSALFWIQVLPCIDSRNSIARHFGHGLKERCLERHVAVGTIITWMGAVFRNLINCIPWPQIYDAIT